MSPRPRTCRGSSPTTRSGRPRGRRRRPPPKRQPKDTASAPCTRCCRMSSGSISPTTSRAPSPGASSGVWRSRARRTWTSTCAGCDPSGTSVERSPASPGSYVQTIHERLGRGSGVVRPRPAIAITSSHPRSADVPEQGLSRERSTGRAPRLSRAEVRRFATCSSTSGKEPSSLARCVATGVVRATPRAGGSCQSPWP